MVSEGTLLFVRNNDSGVLPQIKDYAAHTGSPRSDGCSLSALTQSPIGMKKEWKRFLREQRLPSQVLDKDEFLSRFGSGVVSFPVVMIKTGDGLRVLVSTDELNRCRELEDLMGILQQRLPLLV